MVFIAVKPQYVGVVLKEVKNSLTDSHTIVSIAAGVTLQQLKVRMLPFSAVLSTSHLVCKSLKQEIAVVCADTAKLYAGRRG